jgi:DNA (cytosine-5)-methyltransferase 1
MRYLSLCSGIEAATVAWHQMGWEPAAFAEIEAFPAAVLRHHYPNTPNLGDMTKWREWNVGAIDLLVGGTPCQSFSVAGLRKGLFDPRGGLMLTFLEIAQSLRPRWVVWENVPGVLSSGGGRDFGSFLGALGELGYGWAYRVVGAQWCRVDGYERAVPQRRRRVFVVGCLGDATRAAQVLFERQSVERNPAARGAKRQGVAADAAGGVESGGWMPNNPGVVSSVCTKWSKGNANIGDGSVSPTLCKPSGSDVHAIAFTPGNLSRRAGPSPNSEVAPTQNCSAGQGDQRTCVAIDLYNQAIDGDRAATLTEACGGTNTSGPKVMQVAHMLRAEGHNASEDGTGRGVPATVVFHPTQDPISSTDGTTHAMGCGSKQGTATVGVAYPINGMCLNKELRDKQMTGIGDESDPMYTVRADGTQHAVAVAPSLTASNDPSRSPQSAEVTQQIAAVHQATMVVRRLTPVECERLQGFPDDYTNIPWRGKAESPDGPRYKALGNSMAVNCMRWIGRRIDAVEKGTELPA